MKKISTLLLFSFLLITGLKAQGSGNVVLFTENGEKFTAILNGLRQNMEPVTNLKISDLGAPNYRLKIIFENTALGEMDKNLYTKAGYEVSMRIKQNRKGEYKLGYVSEYPLAQAPPAPPTQTVIVYGQAPATTSTTTVVEETTTMTTGTPAVGTSQSENVSMNVNVGGLGMDVNMTVTEGGSATQMNSNVSSTMSTTTTTTTTTSSGGDWDSNMDGNTGDFGGPPPCYSMSEADYRDATASIRSKSFSDSKMTLAKQVARANCMSADQVAGIIQLFDFEDDRLEFAKFAYDYCADQQNYYKINDAFEFESTIEELDEYIGGR